MNKELKNPPIFIIGSRKSGTTLLCRMLSSHPNIHIQNELGGFADLLLKAEKEGKKDINHLCRAKYGKSFYQLLKQPEKSKWGLKEPWLIYGLEYLLEIFPNTKIIFIIRDGRAVANSQIRARWGVVNAYAAAQLWKKEINIIKNFAIKHEKNAMLTKYEDIVLTPEKELKKISEFIDVRYSSEMLDYYKKPDVFYKTKQTINIFRPLDRALITKWEGELSKGQIDLFETVSGTTLEENGYNLIGQQRKIPRILEIWFDVEQKVIGAVQVEWRWRQYIIQNFLKQTKNKPN